MTAAVVGLAVMCLALPSAASATSAVPLRRLVASTVTFASDGSRYVAWQTRVGAPVVVFDTRTGAQRRLDLPVGCELANEEQRHNGRDAAAGRFLLSCRGGRSLESALLNGRDGTTIRLPNTADWTAVGTRYVLGVSEASTCVQSRNELAIGEEHGLPCLALYDLASSQVSYRPPSLWPDIDQAGAPPICPRLRQEPLTEQIKHGDREFAYGDGYFAKPGGRLRRDVRIERCHGRPTILPESGGPENEPENFDLRDGLLTWDTAHPGFEFNEYPHSEGANRTRGMLYSYDLSTGRRHDWKLPRLPVRETDRRFSVVSVLGYSTHTANMVFWIATTAGAVTRAGVEVESSAVYVAPLRQTARSTTSFATDGIRYAASSYKFEDLTITRQVAADGKPISGFVSYFRLNRALPFAPREV